MGTRPRTSIALAAILGLLGALALAGVTTAAETTLTAELAGVAEGESPGDEDGTGTASVVLDPETGTACWELTAENIMPVTQSHIHVGAAGVSGGIVVPLDVAGFEGTSEGCVEDQEAAVLQAVIDDPAGHYVNLHTEDFPAGAIRGQLAAAAGDDAPPDTAVPAPDGTLVMLGTVLLLAGSLLGLRALRAATAATRD
ncbi:MAG: CHRD domain-containing protein [Candidatus Limnocylindria bacterium]